MTDSKSTTPAPKRRWFRWLLLAILLLLLGVIATAGVIITHPGLATPLIEKALKRAQFPSNIHNIEADFSWPLYTVNTRFSTQGAGFDVAHANATVTLNLHDLWQQQAFIDNIQLTKLRATANIDTLKQRWLSNKSSNDDWQQFVPKGWLIDCNICKIVIKNQSIIGHLRADGQGVNTINATAKDDKQNQLTATYHADKQQLNIRSQQLNLHHFSQYNAQLRDVSATVRLSNPWQSTANAQISYSGLTSAVTVSGEGENRLRLKTLTNGRTLTVLAEKQDDTITLQSKAIDLTLLDLVKPVVLPLLAGKVSQKIRNHLLDLRVSGQLQGKLMLQQMLNGGKTAYQLTDADLHLTDLSLLSSQQGIDHVTGTLHYHRDNLRYDLTLADSTLTLPSVFATARTALNGNLKGQFAPASQQLSLENIQLSNNDFKQLSASGTLQFGRQRLIDVSGKLEQLKLAKLKDYLPLQLPPQTTSWLSQAFSNGQKNQTTFALKGDLQQFLEDEKFVLRVDTQFQDGTLSYLKNNPLIAIKDAQLNIDGQRLAVAVNQAKLFTAFNKKRISLPITGTVHIDNIDQAKIKVHAKVAKEKMSRLLPVAERSIAKKSIARVKKIVDVSGRFSLDLALVLNVWSQTIKETFTLTLSANQATATLKSYPKLPIKHGKTYVEVNQNGLQALTLAGKLLKQPINIALNRGSDKENSNYHIDIRAKKVNPLAILPRLNLLTKNQAGLIRNFRLLRGEDDYHAQVNLTDKGQLIDVTVESALKQTALRGFSVINKKAGKSLPLKLTYHTKKRRLSADLGTTDSNQLHLITELQKDGNIRGLSLSNQTQLPKYQAGQLALTLKSPALNVFALRQFHQRWKKTAKKGKKRPSKPLKYRLNIDIASVKLNKKTQVPLILTGSFNNLQINSPLLSGTINYRSNHLQATIARAAADKLFALVKTQRVNPEGREVTTIDLASALPQMAITIDQVIYKGRNIGTATIHTSTQGGRYSIDQILLNGPNYYIDASGHEATESQGITTKLQVDFRAEKVARLIDLLKLNQAMDAKFIDISLKLSWPGKAHTLNLRQSYGKGRLNAQNVKLTALSTNVGSVFGLMDITSIIRRVSLDFKNLASSKLTFDTVEGNWNIGGGRAITRDAYATGSIIELQLVGAADLYRRVFDDMDLTVIPKASNIFPVIGAVAGGVVGGAAGLLVQQALGKNINRAVGLPYVIGGTWQVPTVTFAGKRKSAKGQGDDGFEHYDSAR